MSLAEASEARKARLQALRKRKAGEDNGEDQGSTPPVIKNRNFDPESRTLRKLGHKDEAVLADTVEKNVEGLAEKIVEEDKARRAKELDIHNIAPKRVNWDLKRELNKKLVKLDRKTQECIHTLLRQRLSAQKAESDDLVSAMNAQEKEQNTADSDEEEGS